MRRHFLARAMCRFKSINAAMVMLLVAIVSISAVHIAAAIFHSVPCSKYSKSRQATSTSSLLECAKGTLCGAKCAQAEPSPMDRCRRPCSVPVTFHFASDVGVRETPGDWQRSAASERTCRTGCAPRRRALFPISLAAPRRHLAKDTRRCHASCGAEAHLFYHCHDMVAQKGPSTAHSPAAQMPSHASAAAARLTSRNYP